MIGKIIKIELEHILNEKELSRDERRYLNIQKMELRRERDKLKIKKAALERSKAIKR